MKSPIVGSEASQFEVFAQFSLCFSLLVIYYLTIIIVYT